MNLDWLPPSSDFRNGLKQAAGIADAGERLEALARLAQQRLNYVEIIQLDKALGAAVDESKSFVPVRLALLSSSTTDHLVPAIRVAGLRRRLLIDVFKGAFGQYRQELGDPGSPLNAFRPTVVLLSLSARDAVGDIPLRADKDAAARRVAAAVADIRELWRSARDRFGAAVVQQSFLDTSEPLFGGYDRLHASTPFALLTRLNDLVAAAALDDNAALLDVSRASARDGLDAWFDPTRWLQGKLEIAPQAAALYGDLVARTLAAQAGRAKKCLVLDLDNTLWGGVIGDDGLEGIQIGGSGIGEAFAAIQRYVKSLQERGVILAVCSKNEAAIAKRAFTEHPEVVLKLEDFAAFHANWNDKAENLEQIAKELNIGLDALVFLDDNPAERARVRGALPAVAVPELPADPAYYVRRLADAGYFDAIGITAEDRDRARQYSANAQREALREGSRSVADYLTSLEMAVSFAPVTPLTLPRAAQLINKTNQFNLTTRRYTSEELAAANQPSSGVVLQFRLEDRFGDNGIVSVVVLRRPSPAAEVWEIANWVMSCRVFGRQLEDEIMNVVVEMARAQGIRELAGEFVPTERNGVVDSLYRTLGFSRTGADSEPASARAGRWVLRVDDYAVRQTSIARKVAA